MRVHAKHRRRRGRGTSSVETNFVISDRLLVPVPLIYEGEELTKSAEE